MTWTPAPADAEVLARRTALATAVREDLAAAGLVVVPHDGIPSVGAGAHVHVDTLDDESGGGVFVEWKVHFVLSSAAMDALSAGGRENDPSIRLAGRAKGAMRDAMAEILSVAGYTVAKNADDMAPYQLMVSERHPSPSWREWLDTQTARRQEKLTATSNTRPPDDEPDPP
ncbi:hypothetical protein [Actinoallomurus iriomotensis]|uniref:Uncharacterized protein n=1 Tax=Actinoallomurus iriomotensis TaxID=478107 RepID=A0A9W6S8U6_9ACTN|nr:hypothetical protein [Actinoallomurus iriomotensis]GLY87822.1 hypothetical protein Airi02_057510 [Actinoallomurus iriomotensis]